MYLYIFSVLNSRGGGVIHFMVLCIQVTDVDFIYFNFKSNLTYGLFFSSY